MKTAIIIPSRYASTRLPGKPLLEIAGKPLIKWVYEACQNVDEAERVIIATDDRRIEKACLAFGAEVFMTSKHHLSGTDRCAEVASKIDAEIIVNVQGDEPFIDPKVLNRTIVKMKENADTQILTLFHEIASSEEITDPSKVKLTKNNKGQILYFSRSPIPYQRSTGESSYYKHIGIYAFRRPILIEVARLEPTSLELTEGLEQLRWLENGYQIYGLEVDEPTMGIDTPQDLAKAQIIAGNLH